jgi:hypothetical protein
MVMSTDPFGPSFGEKPPVVQANPFADQSANPYAAPSTGYFPPPKPEYSGGVFRMYGNKLVMHRQAILPPRCIKTGEPAETAVRKTLYWHHPAVFLLVIPGILIYAIVALILRKSMTFAFPLTYRARRKLRMRLAIGVVSLLLAFTSLFVGIALSDSNRGGDGSFAAAGVFLFLGLLVTSIVFFFLARVVTPTRITDHYTVVKGVSPAYLAGLPDWPHGTDVP